MASLEHALGQAVADGAADRVVSLIAQGADPCHQDDAGISVLMKAAAAGHADVLQVLLAAGAPWNAFDKRGRNAGEYAMENSHHDAVNVLLEAGVRAELVLGAIERASGRADECKSSASYLQQRVEYGTGGDGAAVLMDQEEKGVMMAWEEPLMEAHAHAICSRGGDILNVGFGLGLIDKAIQRRMNAPENAESAQPRVQSHTIIEAHPDVYAKMLADGWDKKPGVKIVFGRWQDVQNQLRQYDGIFFDTFSEYYDDLRVFHGLLPKLLKKEGLYSYFNGLAADNVFFHAVYCEICKRELASLGLETQFVALPVEVASAAVWERVRNKYWQLETYFLPVAEWTTD